MPDTAVAAPAHSNIASPTGKRATVTWKHSDIPTLIEKYNEGGIDAAKAAFPDKPEDAVYKKLASLGLMGMSASHVQDVESAVSMITLNHVPATQESKMRARHAIKLLRTHVGKSAGEVFETGGESATSA